MNVRELVARVLETVNGNQAELARQLGRSETTISRWANGKTGIDYESALRIARMTGVPPRDVLVSAGLDADLFPASGADNVDDADLTARKFVGALRGVPEKFRAAVVAASVALANAYSEAPDSSALYRPPSTTLYDTHNGSKGEVNSRERDDDALEGMLSRREGRVTIGRHAVLAGI